MLVPAYITVMVAQISVQTFVKVVAHVRQVAPAAVETVLVIAKMNALEHVEQDVKIYASQHVALVVGSNVNQYVDHRVMMDVLERVIIKPVV